MADFQALQAFVAQHARLFVITGAGVSTGSGIPDYRDVNGDWKRPPPMNFGLFMRDPLARARYWARSTVGWRHFGHALPNDAHLALARWEQAGRIELLVTQNVDGLHEAAHSHNVVDLHGRLDRVRCMACEHRFSRELFQHELLRLNPDWADLGAHQAPDGDADLEGVDFSLFGVPPCPVCGGIVKPDVVFFGESVPRDRVDRAFAALAQSDAVLIVGSSLMVYSGFRFATAAARDGLPLAAINIGHTRADALLSFKVEAPCNVALNAVRLPIAAAGSTRLVQG
jgi:NAD-dependent SIR2 family protein deacetylase